MQKNLKKGSYHCSKCAQNQQLLSAGRQIYAVVEFKNSATGPTLCLKTDYKENQDYQILPHLQIDEPHV